MCIDYTVCPKTQKRSRALGASARRSSLISRVAFVALLLALLAVAAAGAFAPAAAAAPDASRIDAFLAQHGSPMTGKGAVFVSQAQLNGIDPAFLVAISGAETSFGQFLYSQNGDECAYNAFNWFYGPTWPQSDFGSWDEAIARVAQGLSGPLYYGAGLYSVYDIGPKYCPDGTDNWMSNVAAFMTALGGDPLDTRLPAVSVQPPAVQPGLVALSGSVSVDAADHEIGQHAELGFTIANRGGTPVALEGIRLAVRGPGAAAADLVSQVPFTLLPGESRDVHAAWPLRVRGMWHGWIEVQQDGQVSRVGSERAFSFRVNLPRDPDVRRWILREPVLSAGPAI